jgi:hypothetical protein
MEIENIFANFNDDGIAKENPRDITFLLVKQVTTQE